MNNTIINKVTPFWMNPHPVEPMAGGTFAKYIAEDYRGTYVCVINNFAGEYCVFRAIHYGILVLDISENSIDGRLECSQGTTQPGPDYKPLEEPVCNNTGDIIDSFSIKAD